MMTGVRSPCAGRIHRGVQTLKMDHMAHARSPPHTTAHQAQSAPCDDGSTRLCTRDCALKWTNDECEWLLWLTSLSGDSSSAAFFTSTSCTLAMLLCDPVHPRSPAHDANICARSRCTRESGESRLMRDCTVLCYIARTSAP